ncbi:alpha/beta fold hydrolase [Aestuariibaculum marinum]|uniref:Alpha/beta hydrolase n=1 Tax=Aestuariibaculum marinum TaxID=2683592 RepID=A0A8J6PSZ7_9FLAO|nr:alpha/beta hydrolase [Aestuariibaculum marinum]MBD0822848.1 alpha/beta hydrolase [Aestuariibaculum marinum]
MLVYPSKGFAAELLEIPKGWSDGYVYANGVRLHYYQAVPANDKPVMVMVHGVTDNGLCWATLALKLQEDYNIYMLDTRGHGLSDPFTCNDDANTLIKDVVGFVKAMDIDNPILLGHSMGAATVMRLGAEYPNVAKQIIMLDPFLAIPGKRRKSESHPNPSKQSKDKPVKNLSFSMFGEPEILVKQNNYAFIDLVEKGKRENPKWDIMDVKYWALSKKQYHGAYSPDAWNVMNGTMQIGDALSKIQVPALVLKADTALEGRKANKKAVQGLNRVTLFHIDGAGHNLHHDALDRTVEIINEFLSSYTN